MASQPHDEGSGDYRVDEAIASYVEAVERGEAPDPGAWIAKYPELARELSQFLADQGALQKELALLSPARLGAKGPASWIERLKHRFEQNWRRDGGTNIEDFLAEVPPENRAQVLVELVGLEVELRYGRGEKVDRDDYLQRFPDDGPIIDQVWHSLQAFADTERFADPAADRGAVTTSHRYTKLTLHKRGGLGVLYRAKDDELHREVVIKFIHERCRANDALLSQFQVEAEVTSRLDHPGVVPVYGTGEDFEGHRCYVMRMIRGRELRQDIQEYHEAGGPADRSRTNRQRLFALLEHLANACNTVAYAHDAGLVHCDLKPANIMIGKYGETYVLDWGLATSFEKTPTFVAANELTIRPSSGDSSNSGQRGGTLGYISPEQLSGTEPVLPASDVYSLGATLHEILTGEPPFNGRNPEVVNKIRCGDFRRPRDVNRRISCRLEAISLKAMGLAPSDRYGTAKQLAADLKNWMRDDEIQAAPDNIMGRVSRYARRHRTITVAVFLALLLVTAAGTWAQVSRTHALQSEEQSRLVVETTLDTFEEICRPLADGEMSNLQLFQPFIKQIQDFTAKSLAGFEDDHSMRQYTGRVFVLRATIAQFMLASGEDAERDYERAAQIFESLCGEEPGNTEYALWLARIQLSQGRLRLQRGEVDPALGTFGKVRKALVELRKIESEDNALVRYLAETDHSLGEAFLKQYNDGSHPEALMDAEDHFNESKRFRELLLQSAEMAEKRDHQRGLARSYGYLGDLHLRRGQVGRARDDYRLSLDLRRELYDQDPNPEHRFQYARGLANFGVLERDFGGDLAGATEKLNLALSIQERLTEQYPEQANFQTDLASTLNLLAEIELFSTIDDPAQADEHRRQSGDFAISAANLYGRLCELASPQKQTNRNPLCGLATSKALLALAEQPSNAKKSAELAAESEKLVSDELGPDEMLNFQELFTLALARALAGDPTETGEAWTALNLSVDRGQNAISRIDRHRVLGFKSLAESPEWAGKLDELLIRLRQEDPAD